MVGLNALPLRARAPRIDDCILLTHAQDTSTEKDGGAKRLIRVSLTEGII